MGQDNIGAVGGTNKDIVVGHVEIEGSIVVRSGMQAHHIAQPIRRIDCAKAAGVAHKEAVVTRAAVEIVLARAAIKAVFACIAVQGVIAGVARDSIIAVTAKQGVVPCATNNCVVVSTPLEFYRLQRPRRCSQSLHRR